MSTTKIQNDNLFHKNSNNFPGGGGSGGSNSDQCQVMPTFILQGPHDRVIKFCRQITPYIPYGSDTVYTKNSYQSYRHPLHIITKHGTESDRHGKTSQDPGPLSQTESFPLSSWHLGCVSQWAESTEAATV